jgi:hypothetical protein
MAVGWEERWPPSRMAWTVRGVDEQVPNAAYGEDVRDRLDVQLRFLSSIIELVSPDDVDSLA